jgi:hypothetical protein
MTGSFLNLSRWDIREWIVVSVIIQFLLLVIFDLILYLFPGESTVQPLQISTQLEFVEFSETRSEAASQKQELSETIVEKERLSEEPPVNWSNAADPSLGTRYSARLAVEISPDDYPVRARRTDAGAVRVAVTLYIASDGRIRDVKIRSITGDGNTAEIYREDFIRSVRNIMMNRARLTNSPYAVRGQGVDFIWDTVITFTLQ